MFGKLMNYELRYLMRIFLPMWIMVLILCTLTRLVFPMSGDAVTFLEGNQAIAVVILVVLTVLSIITASLVTLVVVLQRYYKGMFGDEGYLLFTLPVTTWQMVHAKGLSALLMMIITGSVTVLGVVIASSHSVLWDQLNALYASVMYYNEISAGSVAIQSFWMIAVSITSLAESIYVVYLSITMGQMWKKHPVIGAIGAFYIIELVVSGMSYGIRALLGMSGESFLRSAMWVMEGGDGLKMLAVIGLFMAKSVALVLFYSFVTKVFLEKRLELQ